MTLSVRTVRQDSRDKDSQDANEKLFMELARAAEWRIVEFRPQEIANTAWAFATVNQSDEKLSVANYNTEIIYGWSLAKKEGIERNRIGASEGGDNRLSDRPALRPTISESQGPS